MSEHDKAATPDPPRDPGLDRAYAAGALEEPPDRLDAAIRAAARREVGARPRRREALLRTWRAPVALAAVLVLSVTVVLLLREEGADRMTELQPPAAAPAPPADVGRQDRDAATTRSAEEGQTGARQRRAAPQPDVRNAASAQPASPEADLRRKEQSIAESREEAPRALDAPRPATRPEPPAAASEPRRAAPELRPAPADTLAKQAQSGVAGQVEQERQTPPPRAASPPAAPPAPDAVAGAAAPPPRVMARPRLQENAAPTEDKTLRDSAAESRPAPWRGYENQPPEKWLERMEELRRGGREADVREMLAEFRRRFPQHPVPAALDR